jgi:hypothetical protein
MSAMDIPGKTPGGPVGEIFLSMTLPVTSPVAQWRDDYTATDSAVAQPFLRPVLPWSTPIPVASAGKRVLAPDESVMIVTKDPLCALIYEDKNPGLSPLQQNWVVGVANGTPVIDIPISPGQQLEPDLMKSIAAPGFQSFHGQSLYARNIDGKVYLWCDCGQVAGVTEGLQFYTGAIALAATDTIIITVYRLNDGDEIRHEHHHHYRSAS